MSFSRRLPSEHPSEFFMGCKPLQHVHELDILGIRFSRSLSFPVSCELHCRYSWTKSECLSQYCSILGSAWPSPSVQSPCPEHNGICSPRMDVCKCYVSYKAGWCATSFCTYHQGPSTGIEYRSPTTQENCSRSGSDVKVAHRRSSSTSEDHATSIMDSIKVHQNTCFLRKLCCAVSYWQDGEWSLVTCSVWPLLYSRNNTSVEQFTRCHCRSPNNIRDQGFLLQSTEISWSNTVYLWQCCFVCTILSPCFSFAVIILSLVFFILCAFMVQVGNVFVLCSAYP